MARVRIIKRAGRIHSSPHSNSEKTVRQNEREIACTVKNWITELAERRPADEHRARTQFYASIH